MPMITEDQKKALAQLLKDVSGLELFDYYKRGGWAGQQLHNLLDEATIIPNDARTLKLWLSEDEVRGLFTAARISVDKIQRLENKYWPDTYVELRLASPWWFVKTPKGWIEIGYRKNVMSIDWSDTPVRKIITEDQVTKDDYMVHAWSKGSALTYLCALADELNKV